MNSSAPSSDRSNPFSTRRVRPGVLPYLFAAGEDVADVLSRLAENQWRGQIIGPHGSGKSTLLAALLPAIEKAGMNVMLVELHDGQRRVPATVLLPWGHDDVPMRASTHPPEILVVDGYEQLPWWRRWLLQRRCVRHGVGLLVTAHHSVGLPVIFRTEVDVETARQIVSRLLHGRPDVFTEEEIGQCIERHGQDLREALFELYDLFERRRT